jgi:hypothetical protein
MQRHAAIGPRSIALAAVLSFSCGKGARPVVDGRLDGAPVDGFVVFHCEESDPPCPEDLRYCCPHGPVDDALRCEATFEVDCNEEPLGGIETACSPETGAGCEAPRPYCCSDFARSYCSDHAYLGNSWTCGTSAALSP